MRVLRVENDEGLGPYVTGIAADLEMNSGHSLYGYKQPDPICDGIWQWGENYGLDARKFRYGFESRKQLFEWFEPQVLELFKEEGQEVYEYYVPQRCVRKGESHLAFKYDAAITKRKVTLH